MTADLRLAIPAAFGWLVLGVLIAVPAALASAAIIGWAAAVVLLAGTVIRAVFGRAPHTRNTLAFVALGCVVTALLLSCAAWSASARRPPVLVEASASGRSVTVLAEATESVPSRVRRPFTARIHTVVVGERRYPVSVPVVVFDGRSDDGDGIEIGAQLRISGTVSATSPADSAAFRLFARTSVVIAGPPWYLDWANRLRAQFVTAAGQLAGDGGALLPGLAIGETSQVSPLLDSAMKQTSLSHLTAVSGANCAVVVGLVMVLTSVAGLPRRIRIAASLLVLAGFVVLVTPQPSVLRAGVMATIVLVALARGTPLRGLPVLALAVIILLAIDPWLARSYGFVLSVLATGGLLVLAAPLGRVLAKAMPRPLALAISIPLSAQLVCQPVLLLLSPTIPLFGVPANLLAEPAAPVATVLGLIACILLEVAPLLGSLVLQLAWVPSWWIAAVSRFFASLPGSQIPGPTGATGVVLLLVLLTAALIVTFRRRSADRMLRRVASSVLIVILVGYSGIVFGSRLGRAVGRPGDWQIAVCDVGQGDAVLVRSAAQIGLIDTGPEPALLTECLDELGIGRIQLLVLTHYDLDHVGGTAGVLGRVDHVMVGPSSDAQDDRLRASLVQSGAEVSEVARGRTGILGELSWRVLWPPAAGALKNGLAPGNDSSVTVAFSSTDCAECLSSLFLGDLGEQPQNLMMAANRLGHFDVVKVAHHGSADQSEELYQRIHAALGAISVGTDNRYGHPTDRLLGILTRSATAVSRTDQMGMTLISGGKPGQIRLWSERQGERRGPAG